MNSKNKQTQIDEEVVLSKEMQKKLKLIEKAFH
jgi:hypothetical protein